MVLKRLAPQQECWRTCLSSRFRWSLPQVGLTLAERWLVNFWIEVNESGVFRQQSVCPCVRHQVLSAEPASALRATFHLSQAQKFFCRPGSNAKPTQPTSVITLVLGKTCALAAGCVRGIRSADLFLFPSARKRYDSRGAHGGW